ncbi:MAG: serine/threonine protein kinase [Planctomycetes bacterium]|nr:serine/threonine protein kinase [Planctomycetota bacterium]
MAELPEPLECEVYRLVLGSEARFAGGALSALLADNPAHATAMQALVGTLEGMAVASPAGADLLRRLRRIYAAPRHAARYQHMSTLDVGGFGEVSIVHDRLLGRKVARKTIRPQWGRRLVDLPPELVHRFLDEVQVAAQLAHPAIPPVHDVGVSPFGVPFFTMRLVRGVTLGTVIERHLAGDAAWPLTRLLRVLVDVADAVHYAHGQGVLHRDLKPANVLVGRFGEVCVLDWGLAKAHRELSSATRPDIVASDRQTPLDSLGKGTPGFTAPEQWRGSFHPCGDVFSLGAILHLILLDTPPPIDHATERYDLPTAARRKDAALAAICARALAIRPEHRYPTMAALRDDLRARRDGESVSVLRPGPLQWLGLRARRWIAARHDRMVAPAARLPATVAAGDLPPPTLALWPDAPARRRSAGVVGSPSRLHGLAERLQAIRDLGAEPGRFPSVRELGAGGMANVRVATDELLGREVVVKVDRIGPSLSELQSGSSRTPDHLAGLMLDEAQIVAQLDHPSVLVPYDVLLDGEGRLAMVLPFVQAGSLARMLRERGSAAWRETIPALLQASRGLAFAHGKGVVHGDVKPFNILLGNHGDAYLADWGTAVVCGSSVGDASRILLQRGSSFGGDQLVGSNTGDREPGMVMGTPTYMAPERWADEPMDPRSDVYSLGAVLFELLVGAPWIDEQNVMAICRQVTSQDAPPVRSRNPHAPKALAAVCERALQRVPHARHRDAGEFALALESALQRSR